MINTIPCSCHYCFQKIHSFWCISLLTESYNIDLDIKRNIQLLIKYYDDDYVKHYTSDVYSNNRIFSTYKTVEGDISDITKLINQLKEKEDDYNKNISYLYYNKKLYKDLFKTMEKFVFDLHKYDSIFKTYETQIKNDYERLYKRHQKFLSIESKIIDHKFWPILSQKTVDLITSNISLLDNENNEILRSYVLQRIKPQSSLRVFLSLCNIKSFIDDSKYGGLLFVINDDNRKIILEKLKEMCILCKDKYHKANLCHFKHCSITCAKSYTKINENCVKCKDNQERGITNECKLNHCDRCLHHHLFADCVYNHCFIICSNNGKNKKKNCKECIESNSETRFCHLEHCLTCNHHHKTYNCKFKNKNFI